MASTMSTIVIIIVQSWPFFLLKEVQKRNESEYRSMNKMKNVVNTFHSPLHVHRSTAAKENFGMTPTANKVRPSGATAMPRTPSN